MLQATLHAKTEYNNIRAIASEASGLSGQAFSAQVNTSQAKKTISKYRDDNGSNKSGGLSKGPPLHCYGCGGPHPWFLLEHGIHVIKCPNANNPGICKNTKKVIDCIRSKRKMKQCVTLLAGTELYESTIDQCFTSSATLIFTKFVPNKSNYYLRYAIVALFTWDQ